jgi:protein-L-isoaspartate(D-aspartate) O-methyltransferase
VNVRLAEKEGCAGLFLRLRAEGIADTALLTAIEQTPRTVFHSAAYADAAYQRPICCRSIAVDLPKAPTWWRGSWALQSSRVTGFSTLARDAGFLAAVAGRLAERVITVDRYKTLVQLAQQRFAHLGLGNVIARQVDGLKGVSGEGSFRPDHRNLFV